MSTSMKFNKKNLVAETRQSQHIAIKARKRDCAKPILQIRMRFCINSISMQENRVNMMLH